MPKLEKAVAEKVAAQESQSFDAIPAGVYRAKLLDVTVRESKKDGSPYWVWEFEIEDSDGYDGRRQWVNTSLKDTAHWKLKEVFDAFGYTTDSDTDEIIGESVKLAVVTRIIERGARAGELGNNVDKVLPLGDAADADEDEDEPF